MRKHDAETTPFLINIQVYIVFLYMHRKIEVFLANVVILMPSLGNEFLHLKSYIKCSIKYSHLEQYNCCIKSHLVFDNINNSFNVQLANELYHSSRLYTIVIAFFQSVGVSDCRQAYIQEVQQSSNFIVFYDEEQILQLLDFASIREFTTNYSFHVRTDMEGD